MEIIIVLCFVHQDPNYQFLFVTNLFASLLLSSKYHRKTNRRRRRRPTKRIKCNKEWIWKVSRNVKMRRRSNGIGSSSSTKQFQLKKKERKWFYIYVFVYIYSSACTYWITHTVATHSLSSSILSESESTFSFSVVPLFHCMFGHRAKWQPSDQPIK